MHGATKLDLVIDTEYDTPTIREDYKQRMKKVFKEGVDNRMMRSTEINETSSRSHLLFSLATTWKKNGKQTTSKILFVDLAGAERLAQLGNDENLYEEALFIDESLACFGYVINQLSKKKT